MAQLLSIPPPLLEGLHKIASLSDKDFDDILAELRNIRPRMRRSTTITSEDISVPEAIPQDVAYRIIDTLTALYSSQFRVQVETNVFIKDIVGSLQSEEINPDVSWIGENGSSDRLTQRLSLLLDIPSVKLIVKARDVLVAHANTYASARVISDIRAVFGENADEPPLGAVIVHMLNLDYHSAGRRNGFVVALDTKDIDDLIDILERAKQKTESLKELMNQCGAAYIEVV